MPSPSNSLATLRPDIADSFMEFDLAAELGGYVANKVFPVVEVASQAGTFGKIPLEQLLKKRETKRAPGGGFSRSEFSFETAAYACQQHGAEEPVDDVEKAMYAEFFDAELVAGQRALADVMRNAEDRIADAVFNTSTWTGSSLTTSITNEWDDFSNATPINDVEAAVQQIYDNSGLWANALVINKKVFRNLRLCDQIRDRVSSSGAGSSEMQGNITVQQLAQAFDLRHIIVAGGSENTANEGQSASISPIWSGEYAMVCRVAETGDFKEPCIGRTFHWGAAGSTIGGTVDSYREEQTMSEIIRVHHQVDEIVLYPEAGHLLSNITS